METGSGTGSNKRNVPINRTVSSNWNQRVTRRVTYHGEHITVKKLLTSGAKDIQQTLFKVCIRGTQFKRLFESRCFGSQKLNPCLKEGCAATTLVGDLVYVNFKLCNGEANCKLHECLSDDNFPDKLAKFPLKYTHMQISFT